MSSMADIEAKIRESVANGEEYMSDNQLNLFDQLLLALQQKTINLISTTKEDITKPASEADSIDNASIETDMALKLKLIDRQTKLLSKIDLSRNMIEQKTYGYCEETGEEIGIERLLLRPTATMSVDAKSIREEEEKDYGSSENDAN